MQSESKEKGPSIDGPVTNMESPCKEAESLDANDNRKTEDAPKNVSPVSMNERANGLDHNSPWQYEPICDRQTGSILPMRIRRIEEICMLGL
jgi:hypothetical protein